MATTHQEWAGLGTYTAANQAGTYTPTVAADLWQLRFVNLSAGAVTLAVKSVDEDGNKIHIDGSPFSLSATTNYQYLVTSHNPSMEIIPTVGGSLGAGASALKVYVKAWTDSRAGSPGAYTAVTVA